MTEVAPFFSICIPQYNRTSFLLEALKCLAGQTSRNFEVCISDDRSPDGRQQEIISFLQQAGIAFAFVTQEKNLRYDGNLRASMALAKGRYCLLHGNDDCLKGPGALQHLHDLIIEHGCPEVVIPNFEDWTTGSVTRRVRQTALLGSGPSVAAANFRNVAFVTGVIIDRASCHELATDHWDGSEMYQMWMTTRIIASGGRLLTVDESLVRKDIQIAGESVDSYARLERLRPCPIVERKLPFVQIGRLVADALEPYLSETDRGPILERVYRQLYFFTYPFWLFEYRRVQSWNYAAGICLGIRPHNVIGDIKLPGWRKMRLYLLFGLVGFLGLTLPLGIFDRLQPQLYAIAKKIWQRPVVQQ